MMSDAVNISYMTTCVFETLYGRSVNLLSDIWELTGGTGEHTGNFWVHTGTYGNIQELMGTYWDLWEHTEDLRELIVSWFSMPWSLYCVCCNVISDSRRSAQRPSRSVSSDICRLFSKHVSDICRFSANMSATSSLIVQRLLSLPFSDIVAFVALNVLLF